MHKVRDIRKDNYLNLCSYVEIIMICLYMYIFLTFAMANQANQTVEAQLRDYLNRYATELYNYRQLYSQSQREYNDLFKVAEQLQTDNQILAQGNNMLIQQNQRKDATIVNLKAEVNATRVKDIRKEYCDLKSRSQKKIRRDDYRRALNNTIRHFPDVVSASVQLNVGSEWLQLLYSANDIDSPNGISNPNLVAQQINLEHNYALNSNLIDLNSVQDDEAKYEEIDPTLISSGKISQRHIRKTVHVIDKYKIPQHAYHELRMSCKGILPSISTLSKERLLMSSEIPYVINPDVSALYFYLNF